MRDFDIAKMIYVDFSHLPRAEAVQLVASRLGTTRTTVAGRASRYYNTISGRASIMKLLSEKRTGLSHSDHIINGIVQDGQLKFNEMKNSLNDSTTYTAVKISDIHFPYADYHALELVYEIISRLTNVVFISTLDDMIDFPKLSHYDDRRRLRAQAIDDDVGDTLVIVDHHLKTLRDIAPDATLVAVPGNHDIRIATYQNQTGVGVYNEAGLMKWFTDRGVVFLDRLSKLYVVSLTDNLVWAHGWRSSSNRVSCAKANYLIAKRELNFKHDFYFVFGHTHDIISVPHFGGLEIINGGCLCDMNPHYMRHSPQWQHGIVVSQFQNGNDIINNFVIPFKRRDNNLVAFVPPIGDEVSVSIGG